MNEITPTGTKASQLAAAASGKQVRPITEYVAYRVPVLLEGAWEAAKRGDPHALVRAGKVNADLISAQLRELDAKRRPVSRDGF